MRHVAGMRQALQRRPRMPDEEMNALAVAAHTDPLKREKIVIECMGLIAATSKRARNMLGEDAFGEASVAFLEAIDSYESEQGDFRTWAVYLMTCRLAKFARTEKNYRARLMSLEEIAPPSDPTPMPELLTEALVAGLITDRQAGIVHMRASGGTRDEIMGRFSISERTYFYDMSAALLALRSYL